jgi:hypothetical protein
LVANVSKHPYKSSRGHAVANCGKIGHNKADECRFSKTITATGGTDKQPVDKANVTCFNCQEKGHYANKCTKPKKGKAANDMARLVGASCVEVVNDGADDAMEISVSGSILDTFFDDWGDNSWDVTHGADDMEDFTTFFDDDIPVPDEVDTHQDTTSEFVNVSAVAAEFVGTAAADGTEE